MLILADAVLATSLGSDHLLPVLARAMRSRDLRMRGKDLRQALPLAVDPAGTLRSYRLWT